MGEDEQNKVYFEGSNGRKISIIAVTSPVRNSKKNFHKNSEDRATYQASTLCSNTMNKFSRDFFSDGEDEVNQERPPKNRDVLNMLSESDFEQYSRGIVNDYQKVSKELTTSKKSQNRPFSS